MGVIVDVWRKEGLFLRVELEVFGEVRCGF